MAFADGAPQAPSVRLVPLAKAMKCSVKRGAKSFLSLLLMLSPSLGETSWSERERGYIWLSTSEEKRSVAELSFPMEIVYQQRSDGARCRIEEQSSHPLAHDAALFYFFSR